MLFYACATVAPSCETNTVSRNLKQTQMEQMKTTKNIGNIKIETNKCKKNEDIMKRKTQTWERKKTTTMEKWKPYNRLLNGY